ncbi:MAG TPA: nucleotidyltransferase domain-containing protein [Longimicrobiales bacterium]|jgi:predicted nucleotidyltransferase
MEGPQEQIRRIAERYDLRDVYVFGSRAAEIAGRVLGGLVDAPPSAADLDIAVQPPRGQSVSARDRVRLVAAFEDLFGAPRVDLVILSEASAFMAVEVIRGELLFTADPLAQAEQELFVLRRAADLAPFRHERVRAILQEGAR